MACSAENPINPNRASLGMSQMIIGEELQSGHSEAAYCLTVILLSLSQHLEGLTIKHVEQAKFAKLYPEKLD
jgi:hypothetical protein